MKSNLELLLCLFCLLCPQLRSEQAAPSSLAVFLPTQIDSPAVPSLAAAVVSPTGLIDSAAFGFRKEGDTTPVTLDDRYHLGSCTKTMTATLAAILVDENLIRWDSTIGEILGEALDTIHPDFQTVTLEQLLAHVGGLATKAPNAPWMAAWANQGKLDPRSQRLAFLKPILSSEPDYTPGSKSEYSNQGYAVAGAMLETVANTPWESLITAKLFLPLGMESAGFRTPASPESVNQPWGHRGGFPVPPGPGSDNPDAIGPAATAHASIQDWAKFAQYHLIREPAPLLKNQKTLDKLHTILPQSDPYGVGGWVVHDIERLGGHCLQMVGSNTMWYALFWVIPEREIAIVAASNSGDPKAFAALDQTVGFLIQRHAHF